MTAVVIDMALARERKERDPAMLQKRREEDLALALAEYRADPVAFEAREEAWRRRERVEVIPDELARRAT